MCRYDGVTRQRVQQLLNRPYKDLKCLLSPPRIRGELSSRTSPEEVERMLSCNMPPSLRQALMPFQEEGVRFGLQRQGRCLIADEVR